MFVKLCIPLWHAAGPNGSVNYTWRRSTAVTQRNNNQKHCKITETNCPSADLVEAFIKIIEEKADTIDKVDHLEIWMPSTASEQSVNYLAQLGFLNTEGLMARHMLDRLRVIEGLHY
ncbi:uncharacterized protein LOC113294520 [Papaver somniferum]|uniref:uncharacterized protein LOC113294520 n=1 Tax=Papaver somniferum TaxID=3469 RepID=UPI000E70320E|nr:uncharacterized protein LOC113294520 [Papaver somniferum]